MADTATTPLITPDTEEVKHQQATEIPSVSEVSEILRKSQENQLKRSHPEYDEKSKEELVATEKAKIQIIHTLVNEVQQETKAIDDMIAEARGSKDVEERKVLISDIKVATAEVKDKVLNAAQLESDVVEINAVLKEKHVESDANIGKTTGSSSQ
jgi:uncharacterized protein YqeY